ncbi:ImmA/IrrE family metallo-endopeptidase [Sphingomonas sp. XXL09]|uniref:ImmA/IrrE family metallo-endopeptidase n=1 Tax=Sphingomonas sp. XXL09 TaxID=3457787 RepID=UPI00406BD285
MNLRRGFKAEANALSREFRQELGIELHDPLCPYKLAEHLGVPVVPLSDFANDNPEAVAYFATLRGQKDLSALTLCLGAKRLIIYNDRSSPKRRAADLAHEISHIVLHHPPMSPFDANGRRHYDDDLEGEANWLGPALLVSEEAALHIVEQGFSIQGASTIYKVSEQLVRMRLGVTGAMKRVARRAA